MISTLEQLMSIDAVTDKVLWHKSAEVSIYVAAIAKQPGQVCQSYPWLYPEVQGWR
jgi:hypothetical protein